MNENKELFKCSAYLVMYSAAILLLNILPQPISICFFVPLVMLVFIEIRYIVIIIRGK